MLLDAGSGTEPKIKFPDHDQDPGGVEAGVVANADCLTNVPAKEILDENFEDGAARTICYLRIKQFQLEISFQNQHKPSRRQEKEKLAWKTSLKNWKMMCSTWHA